MTLQVNEFEMLIIKTSLDTRLDAVNSSIKRINGEIEKCKELVDNAKAFRTMYPSILEGRKETLDENVMKRDIMLEEVYQLENLIHEVNKARLK